MPASQTLGLRQTTLGHGSVTDWHRPLAVHESVVQGLLSEQFRLALLTSEQALPSTAVH